MSDPYERVKGGRLMFKGGAVASRSKAIDKKKKKKKNKSADDVVSDEPLTGDAAVAATEQQADTSEDIYTIDAAKQFRSFSGNAVSTKWRRLELSLEQSAQAFQ
ncbi:hypothetical protein HAX54_025867 [Datura stramonium]|uniref:Uncharacterized protein n=1 Tax=Datura stramonium TaxID=4076 RepID=A0ABS8V0X8_DATST|nr:hypothetical protein [Datura stramonium]